MGCQCARSECKCGSSGVSSDKQLKISLTSGALFYLIAHPSTFEFMRSILGKWVASASGCPTRLGLVLHAFLFVLLTWGLMNIKK